MSTNISKLQKLTITAYADVERRSQVGEFHALFNPQSYQRRAAVNYANLQGINSSGKTQQRNTVSPTVWNGTKPNQHDGDGAYFCR